MSPDSLVRAVLVGPGRIGRQHAKWLVASGCELVGFACSDAAHLNQRADELRQTAGCDVAGFDSVEELLDRTRPDLACICSPAELHHDHALACLQRRIAVLVEKPLCWAPDPADAVAQGEHLAAIASASGVVAGVNLQYTFAASPYEKLVGKVDRCARVDVILESRGRGAERTPPEVWMELGPHALSVALALVPGATADLSGLSVETAPRTARVSLDLLAPHGAVAATLEVGQRPEGALARRFGLDGQLVDYAGRNNAAGVYCTTLSCGGVERESPDWMAQSIQGLVQAVTQGNRAPISLEAGVANLAVQAAVAGRLAGTPEGRSHG